MTRANSVSYGDMRNIVCLCQRHHKYFKEQHGRLYWELIERHVGAERWDWIKRVEEEARQHRAYRFYTSDWLKIEAHLKTELTKPATFNPEKIAYSYQARDHGP